MAPEIGSKISGLLRDRVVNNFLYFFSEILLFKLGKTARKEGYDAYKSLSPSVKDLAAWTA